MRILFTVILLFTVLIAPAQKAVFMTDNSYNENFEDAVKEMQWLINGKLLTWGGTPVEIQPNPKKFDTVLFKPRNNAGWDTIICNIAQPHNYSFTFNACCGGFDVDNITLNKRPKGRVYFMLDGKKDREYLGFLGETGILLNKKSYPKPITAMCRSAMSPNIYWVQLKEIEVCKDSAGCTIPEGDLQCYLIDDKDTYDFYYREKKTITRFLYMPLDDKPLNVVYYINKNKVELK